MKRTYERRIERWLSQARRALPGSRAANEEIIDALAEHIESALAERCTDRDITRRDVEAVLAEMDPLERFGIESEIEWPAADPEQVLVSRVALWTLVGAVAVAGVGHLLGGFLPRFPTNVPLVVGGVALAAAGVMGFVSWRIPLGRAVAIIAVVLASVAIGLVPVRREGEPPQPVEQIEHRDGQ